MKKYINFIINTLRYFLMISKNRIVINKARFSYLSQIRHLKEKGAIIISDSSYIDDFNILSVNNGFIKIGENCSINPFCVFYGHGGISIGNNVMIASHTTITSFSHGYKNIDLPMNQQENILKEIVIEDNVWIGSGVKILAGVKIGQNVIIGANSVVNKDLESNSIFAGVPCKLIRKRPQNEI